MENNKNVIAIVATKRTPIGQFLGGLSPLSAPHLAAQAIEGMLNTVNIGKEEIDEIILGCVLPAGIGQAPARQAGIFAKIPESVGATTINKVCGSGMKAIMLAHDIIRAGQANIILAGGMESMSNAPYLLTKARTGYRMGHQTMYDHMILDGLEDAYEKGLSMGVFAEKCAEKYGFTREMQDAFSIHSLERAQKAIKAGQFKAEIIPVKVQLKKETIIVSDDECPLKAQIDKIPLLKPAFKENGSVTAANSSGISDGAAVHLLMTMAEAERRQLKPLAKILAHATHSQEPAWFTIAPVQAIQKVLNQLNWQISDVDLFEINEAFAVVTMAAMKDCDIPADKINIHGGACALGHPIGATGARIVTTLIYALKEKGLKRGIAALCIGGGEATALAIELL